MTMKKLSIVLLALLVAPGFVSAQSKSTRIQGNTEIDASSENTTAIATGENNVAKNRIGVIKGDKKGDTKISVKAANVTTVVGGRNKKACTNIGSIVSDECK